MRKLSPKSIEDGLYGHLGITAGSSSPVFPAEILPAPGNGRFSKINVHGKEVVRKDLPMVTKTFSVETPNFGDWSLGSHTVDILRDVYPRVPPGPRDRLHLCGRITHQYINSRARIGVRSLHPERRRKAMETRQPASRSRPARGRGPLVDSRALIG